MSQRLDPIQHSPERIENLALVVVAGGGDVHGLFNCARGDDGGFAAPDRHEQQFGAANRRVAGRLRERRVLADEQRDAPEVGLKHRHVVSRRDARGHLRQRELDLAVLRRHVAVAIEQHRRVVQKPILPLEHAEHDVDRVSTREARHHVRARTRHGFRLRVVGARRADHVQQFPEHHHVRMVLGRDLLSVLRRPLHGVETAAGSQGTKRHRRDLDRSRRRRRRGGEAEPVEPEPPVRRPLEHQLDIDGGRPRRRLQRPVVQQLAVGLRDVVPDIVRRDLIAERPAPPEQDRDRFARQRDLRRRHARAEAVVAAAAEPLNPRLPAAVDTRDTVADDFEGVGRSG